MYQNATFTKLTKTERLSICVAISLLVVGLLLLVLWVCGMFNNKKTDVGITNTPSRYGTDTDGDSERFSTQQHNIVPNTLFIVPNTLFIEQPTNTTPPITTTPVSFGKHSEYTMVSTGTAIDIVVQFPE